MKEKETLNGSDFKFNKKFGQNFIFDKNLLAAIVEDSKISKSDEVLEIGPGAGTLTKIIASKCKKVVSYEIDKTLEPVLKENLKECNNSTVIYKDALKEDISLIESNFEGEYKLVANLPYYITTPLIFKFIKQTNRVKSMCIMVQKEVGERLCASAKDSVFGAISVILDFYGDVKVVRQVNRKMFTPSPNVDSCVVRIDFNHNKYLANGELFEKMVKAAFSNRRKTLANNLSAAFNISKQKCNSVLEELFNNKNIRGDELSTADFVRLTNYFDTNGLN